jgi:hypothetical protein
MDSIIGEYAPRTERPYCPFGGMGAFCHMAQLDENHCREFSHLKESFSFITRQPVPPSHISPQPQSHPVVLPLVSDSSIHFIHSMH